MISVWYDPDCDQIWITDADRSYARRSLVTYIAPSTGKIGIRLKSDALGNILETPFTNLSDKSGFGFPSAAEAKAYLDGEFAKRRPSGDRVRLPVDILQPGQSVISLQDPPLLLSSVRLIVNGIEYGAPDIAASNVAVTWTNPDFLLDRTDRVVLAYS